MQYNRLFQRAPLGNPAEQRRHHLALPLSRQPKRGARQRLWLISAVYADTSHGRLSSPTSIGVRCRACSTKSTEKALTTFETSAVTQVKASYLEDMRGSPSGPLTSASPFYLADSETGSAMHYMVT